MKKIRIFITQGAVWYVLQFYNKPSTEALSKDIGVLLLL